jgi:hypothetical protein
MTGTGQTTIIVKHAGHPGLLAGLLGCVFAILGIFTFGIIFVPLAAICSLIGLLRGVMGLSAAGIGCSLLAAALTVWGFVFSPSLWLLVGAGILASHLPASDVAHQVAPAYEASRSHALSTPLPAPVTEVPPGREATQPTPDETRALAVLGQLESALPKMEHFNSAVDAWIAKIPTIENRYKTITARMTDYLNRERQLSGLRDPRAGVARSQISVAMSQASIATDQLHIQVQPVQSEFDNQVAPLRERVFAFVQPCRVVSQSDPATFPTTYSRLSDACGQLAALSPIFLEKYGALSQGLHQLEDAYNVERGRQEQLVQVSNQIQW